LKIWKSLKWFEKKDFKTGWKNRRIAFCYSLIFCYLSGVGQGQNFCIVAQFAFENPNETTENFRKNSSIRCHISKGWSGNLAFAAFTFDKRFISTKNIFTGGKKPPYTFSIGIPFWKTLPKEDSNLNFGGVTYTVWYLLMQGRGFKAILRRICHSAHLIPLIL